MVRATPSEVGSVVALWRYPVKSMLGEEVHAAEVTERGLLGDRAYALVDSSTGRVVSAKNPRKWARLFDCRATFASPPRLGATIPSAHITLPDGSIVSSAQDNLPHILANVLGRPVTLATTAPPTPNFEIYWPDMEGLAHRDTITDVAMPGGSLFEAGTFFDFAVLHLLTTATIDCFRHLYPQGRFEVRRFRPNIVIAPTSVEANFMENDWIHRILAVGNAVRLRLTRAAPRCVMTTLPQGDLPGDAGILRTIAQHNRANAGVYAEVLQGGTIRRGDPVRLE